MPPSLLQRGRNRAFEPGKQCNDRHARDQRRAVLSHPELRKSPIERLIDQARALAWIERILRRDILSESVMSRHWVTSELLMALRRLKSAVRPRKIS